MGQQNPNPQPEEVGRSQGKNRRDRPFAIESRWNCCWLRGVEWTAWRVSGRYRTEAERDAALENLQRKNGQWIEFRREGGE